MNLETWSFSKRTNSTARPASAGRVYNVYLKEDTSIEHPHFIIGTGIDSSINYCLAMGNYYYIDDIIMLTNDQSELVCSIDVLATHKDAIGAYTCYIERSASNFNSMIHDPAVSSSQEVISESVAEVELSNATSSSGVYVMGVVGGYGSGTAGISTYVLTASELEDALDFMFTEGNFMDVLTDSIVKSFFNPFQYIVFLRWYPFNKSVFGTLTSVPIKFGWWSTTNTFDKCNNITISFGQTLAIPAGFYNDFRSRDSAYTQMDLEIPSVGTIKLDPSQLSAQGIQLLVGVNVDIATGTSVARIETVTGAGLTTRSIIGSYTGHMGASIPVGQVNGEMASLISSATALASGIMLRSPAAAVGGISGVVGSYNPPPSMLGTYGSRAFFSGMTTIRLSTRCYATGEVPTGVYGRMCCKNLQIGTLSGYVKCNGASISLAAPDTEIAAVNNYLNGGFYYE